MGTMPNPIPIPNSYPIRSPLPNSNLASNPNPNTNPNPAPAARTPSFEEVSKLFSLPLSDAAETLGVCPSVLKKVCYENGLVRWPYRQFLSGRSIEEIKERAAIEKKKYAELKVAGERNDSLAVSAVSSSPGPQPLSTNAGSLHESTIRVLTQQPMKDNQIDSIKGNLTLADEFKYGFPSDGLSSVSFRWWGNKSDDNDDQQSGSEDAEKKKQQLNDSQDTAAANSSVDGKVTESSKNETKVDSPWACKLTALRKKGAEEGKQALRLGVYRGQSAKSLDKNKRKALLQVFRTSLPSEWLGVGDISQDS